MKETQQSISEWADRTFGPAQSNARVAARANEELAELLRAVTSGNRDKTAEEAADVMIVLFRVAQRSGVNSRPLSPTGPHPLWDDAIAEAAAMANTHMAKLLQGVMYNDKYPLMMLEEGLRCVHSWLRALCEHLGTTLEAEIDRKMEINRSREWKVDGTGHGYHVREKS